MNPTFDSLAASFEANATYWVTAADNAQEHAVSETEMLVGITAGGGVYRTACGLAIVAASMTTPPAGLCPPCKVIVLGHGGRRCVVRGTGRHWMARWRQRHRPADPPGALSAHGGADPDQGREISPGTSTVGSACRLRWDESAPAASTVDPNTRRNRTSPRAAHLVRFRRVSTDLLMRWCGRSKRATAGAGSPIVSAGSAGPTDVVTRVSNVLLTAGGSPAVDHDNAMPP